MSFKRCLFGTALLLPACIEPAVQGASGASAETTDAATETTTDPATGATEPDTATIGETAEPVTSTTPDPTTDPGPTCDDGQKNGDESDIDCGGGCTGCDGDAACSGPADCKSGRCDGSVCFPLVRSCLELHAQKPALPSGSYPLDPDGDGAGPLDFVCDMEAPSPGWTQVFVDVLDAAPDGAWSPIVSGECGTVGAILGPYGAGDTLALAISAQQVPHTELRLAAEAVIMDSWDAFNDERLWIRLDGAEIFTKDCDWQSAFTCGQDADLCNDPGFNDAVLPIATEPAAHDGDPIALEFTSNLDEPTANEAWALAKVAVLVK